MLHEISSNGCRTGCVTQAFVSVQSRCCTVVADVVVALLSVTKSERKNLLIKIVSLLFFYDRRQVKLIEFIQHVSPIEFVQFTDNIATIRCAPHPCRLFREKDFS